ncbi:hypothetical protein FNI11_21795 [Salmonella enterica subsp. salamae]|nr:hypothetical protein [Salmonella enterica subsp. salamae]
MCVGFPRSPQSLTRVSSWGLMRDILVPHRRQPSAVQIRSGRICHCVAAFLQLELFRALNDVSACKLNNRQLYIESLR